jgi:uncharacterized protein (TIGR02118 family)
MKCVAVTYPNKDGARFDFEYYLSRHIPMVADLLSTRIEVSRGIGTPDTSPLAFLCVARIWIKSVEEHDAAMNQHGAKIMGDIPNYTNVTPIVQIEEVLRSE